MIKQRTDKQNAILDEALALISERGFHDAPISAIARRAGVGAGTIYRYYETKDDLIKDLYIREKQTIYAQMISGCDPELSVKENFRRIWFNVLRVHSSAEARYRFLDQFYNSPYSETVTAREREELAADVHQLVDRGIRDGVIRDLPFAVIGAVVMGAVHQLALLVKCGDVTLTDELTEATFDACWRAIST